MPKAAPKKRRRQPPRPALRYVPLGLFGLALLLRWLFWQATPDAAWPYSAYYKGDAATWLAYADALQRDERFELGLPLRPPAAGYLVAALWNGRVDGIAALRLLWCVLGALIVPLIYAAARRSFGAAPALVTGLLCAASTGLMMLSTSLNNETPYLLLVAATLYLWPSMRRQPGVPLLALWGGLHALASLTRVEHALYFAGVTAALVLLWRRRGGSWRSPVRRLAITSICFALTLAPWHLHAWEEIRRFNSHPPPTNPATEAAWSQVEAALAVIDWDPGALGARQELPAFIRRTASNFVAATVLTRGRRTVTAADFEILEEAFGYRPRAIAGRPFVALYGGLNFYLATNPHVEDGFDRSLLEEPPPLAGGAALYPRALLAGLPPPDLALTYPPHLEIFNRGYALGSRWIRDHPGDFLALVGHKLRLFWHGATLGFGGYNLPLGLSGVRRPVDLLVPEGGLLTALWRLAVSTLALYGLWTGARDRRSATDLLPWLLFLASKVVVVIVFFGYARHGASVIPVIALLLALAGAALATRRTASADDRTWRRLAAVAALALVTIEAGRWMARPTVTLDERRVGPSDPWPIDRHVRRQVLIR